LVIDRSSSGEEQRTHQNNQKEQSGVRAWIGRGVAIEGPGTSGGKKKHHKWIAKVLPPLPCQLADENAFSMCQNGCFWRAYQGASTSEFIHAYDTSSTGSERYHNDHCDYYHQHSCLQTWRGLRHHHTARPIKKCRCSFEETVQVCIAS